MSSTTPSSFYFRRRIGRAASPPTWACYEQIHNEEDGYSDSGSDDCSEDDEEYGHDEDEHEGSSDSEDNDHSNHPGGVTENDVVQSMDMDVDEEKNEKEIEKKVNEHNSKKDIKGKQRAVDTAEGETPRRSRKKHREPTYTLRPILTIHKSQGFVWNQDLFVPPYIKDRYIASTSPPNSKGFISSSSSNNSALNDYEVEVVEIRVQEGELDDIIP